MHQMFEKRKDRKVNQVTIRKVLRWFHILGGLTLGTYLYSPWGSDPIFTAVTLFVVTPGLVISGVWMWKQGAIARLFRRGA